MRPTFRFDKLYVISDLHFGGEAGFQIFGSTDEMEWFLDQLVKHDLDHDVGLVINGDFIDFLAEEPAMPFDPAGAIRKLERIARDPTFAPIFKALETFTATPRRKLIVNLGNHDIELALPWVRDRLAGLLAETAEARTRLHFVLDGSGFLASVGNHSVLCVHGNEVDRWNPVDFEKIREIARDIQFGRPVKEWMPNAGTQLVIKVMNTVKRDYPFVDLLKPEKQSVVPTLAACDPGQFANLEHIKNLVAVGGHRFRAAVDKPRGMLSADGPSPRPDPSEIVQTSFVRADASQRAAELMRLVEVEADRGTQPLDLVRDADDEQLGLFRAGIKLVRRRPTDEVLREALDSLDQDRSFDANERDDTAIALDREISPEIDFLVAGHTHLERALPRHNGSGYYFNSGTWARLIQIAREVRTDATKFKALFNRLKHGTMTQLDATPGVLLKRCTVVVLERQSTGATNGRLRNVVKTDQAIGWADVPNTTFERTS